MNKPKAYLLLSIFSITIISIQSCKKNKIETKNEKNKPQIDSNLSAPPNTAATIANSVELYEQLAHLASGLAGIFENNLVNQYGRDNLTNLLTTNIPTGDNEIPIASFHNLVQNLQSGQIDRFSLNGNPPAMPNSSDLYDAIFYCKNTFVSNPNISSWKNDFYSYFNIGNKSFFTVIRVPELNTQGIQPLTVNTPIILIPDNTTNRTTYEGFTWNKINNSVKIISGLNDDIVEDHITNKTAYIIVVSYDKTIDGTSGGRESSNCEGEPICNDDYCDLKCGESETCLDCLPQNNKTLYLYKVRIENDERISKNSGTGSVEDNYFVSVLGGKYKLVLNSIVLHANGKWDALTNTGIRPKWKQNEVRRIKNSTNGRGSNTMKIVWSKNNSEEETNQKGIKLANNFNPRKARIYISLGEEDDFWGSERYISPIAYNGIPISLSQYWETSNMPSLCGPDKKHFYKDQSLNTTPMNTDDAYVEILPANWVDPNNPLNLLDEIEIRVLNATFVLKYEN